MTESKIIEDKEETLFRKILIFFGCKRCCRSHFGNKIVYIESIHLDEKIENDSYLSHFFDMVWNENWISTYPYQIDREYLEGSMNRNGCVCSSTLTHTQCKFTFPQFLKCSFTKLSFDQINELLGFIGHNYNFYHMLTLSTALNSIEKSDKTVVINPFNENLEEYPIYQNLEFEFTGPFKNTDKIVLEWYTSDSGQYKILNEKMRKGIKLTYVELFILEKLAELINKSRFTKDMILYRGISETKKDNIEKFQKTHQTSQFLSTSLDISIAYIFKEKPCCMFHIYAYKNNIGLYVPMLDPLNTESEVLLPPGINLVYKSGTTTISYEYKNLMKEDMEEVKVEDKREDKGDYTEIKFNVESFPKLNLSEMKFLFDLTTREQKIDFMKKFEFKLKMKDELFTYLNPIIPLLNIRNSNNFDRTYERVFGDFMTNYFDKMGINIDPILNSSLTVEKGSKSLLIPYSIRTILNHFIAATDKNLQKSNIGRLYKTGGESIRYYTQEFGDQITNDIDSKLCLYYYSLENVKNIFPKIAKTIIYMAGHISTLDFSVHKSIIVNDQIIGSISSDEFIDDYITIRTNYVGNCYEDRGGSKDDTDCMIIISIDINFKIKIDNPLYGGPFYFYKKTAPYDFLFSKETCKYEYIQNREHDTEPPIVSLKFVINDLYHLLNPQGDLERRINTNKHQKDIKRYNSIMKIMGKKPSENRLKDLKDLLSDLKSDEKMRNTEYITNNLDKPCTKFDIECTEFVKTIDSVWEDETVEQTRMNDFLGINERSMKHKISELKKIIDAPVYRKFFVNIK